MNDLLGLVKQCQRDTHRWFPNIADSIPHHALSMAGEVGEVCNLVKKVERGSISLDAVREQLGEEAVDVLIYLCCIFAELGVNPVEIYKKKRTFNEQRFGNGTGLPNGHYYPDGRERPLEG